MAEIRIRDAAPELIKGLQTIATELREATITGCLTKMIPRYLDMKKRIAEQNQEIADLSKELRDYAYRKSNMDYHFNEHVGNLKKSLSEALRAQKTFGTKKKTRQPAPAKKSKRLSHSKKQTK